MTVTTWRIQKVILRPAVNNGRRNRLKPSVQGVPRRQPLLEASMGWIA
jgi:hypothetical protein